jgi:16S rRNA (cytosine1402-N4)-methyltransferase
MGSMTPQSSHVVKSHRSDATVPAFRHVPVLLEEALGFVPAQARVLVDATLGGGGHAEALLRRFPEAELFGCDRDCEAVEAARRKLAPFGERTLLKPLRFAELHHYVLLGTVDCLLADLGVSSHQLDVAERGFSVSAEGPLDMRMDSRADGPTAADLVNQSPEERLRDWFWTLGEERFAPRIVQAVSRARRKAPIRTTTQLARIVAEAVPAKYHRKGFHPATKVFQALRMAVNGELEELETLLDHVPALLAPRGRAVVIAFHSLEDRMVKERFRRWENPCVCPPSLPRCACGAVPLGRRLTRKPVTASEAERARNPRSRSAKLRAFEAA